MLVIQGTPGTVPCPLLECDATIEVNIVLVLVDQVETEEHAFFQFGIRGDHDELMLHLAGHQGVAHLSSDESLQDFIDRES